MHLRTNLVISVVFAGLLAFVYFHEIKGGEKRELEAERARQLVDFSDHEARRLTIDGGDTTLVIERADDVWYIREPLQTGADAEAVDRFLRSLKEAEIEGYAVQDSTSITQDSSILAVYGLDEPRLQVHLELAESAEQILDTLRFGADTPTERFTYVQRSGANPEIRTMRAWRYDNLAKGLFDLRDRKVLHFDKSEIVGMRLAFREGDLDRLIVAERREERWALTSPLAVAGDDAAFDEVLTRLGNAQIVSFEYEEPTTADLEAAGLSDGDEAVHLTLLVDADRAEKHLRLGKRYEQGDHLAIDTSRDPIFVIDSTVVIQLKKKLDDLRDRKPFDIAPESVLGIDLTVANQTLFRAMKDSSGSGWHLTSNPDREAKTWRLNDLLTSIADLRVESFVADAPDVLSLDVVSFGFDQPALRLALHLGVGETIFVDVAEHEGTVYARRADVPSIYAVAETALRDLAPTLDDVAMAPQQATADPDAATEVTLVPGNSGS